MPEELYVKKHAVVNGVERPVWEKVSDNAGAYNDILGTKLKQLMITMPLRGVLDNTVSLVGEHTVEVTGQTTDYTTDFGIGNNHLMLVVNSITTGGDIIITGDSIDESTGVVTKDDTETITVDTTASQHYQSSKKFWVITNIDISAGTIAGINYDIGVLGYMDLGNRNFKIVGYDLDAFSQGTAADFAIKIIKVKDDGNKKHSMQIIENIGVDSGNATNQIIDNVRTGGNSRSYDPPVSEIWANNCNLGFKQSDFDTFFSSGENQFLSSTKDEGFFIQIVGSPSGGISNVDWIILRIDYELM